MNTEQIVYLLVAESTPEDIEKHLNTLKNAGFAVRENVVKSLEALEEALADKSWDVLICAEQTAGLTSADAVKLCKTKAPDLPVLVITDHDDSEKTLKLLKEGAAHCIPRAQAERLRLALLREVKHVDNRKKLTQLAQALQESELRCRSLMDSSRDAIAYIHDGMHIYTNDSYLEMFGITNADELAGMPILDMIGGEHQGEFKKMLRTLDEDQIDPDKQFIFKARRANDSGFKAAMKFSRANVDGEPCIQVVIQDISQDEELKTKLKELATTDLVTGLFNRQYLIETITGLIGGKEIDKNHLIFLKLDNYTALKDNIGTAGFDIAARDIADIIRHAIPHSLCSAHFSDDIFTILVRNDDPKTSMELAEKLRDTIGEHVIDIEGKTYSTTISVGFVQMNSTHKTAQRMLTEAERACTTAQTEGGNTVRTMQTLVVEGTEDSAKKIRHALDNNKFKLVFQPIVSLHAEPGERYEVLLRMTGDNGEEISPAAFLPVAEMSSMLPEIDRWVIKQSVSTLAYQRRNGKELKLFVKLSEQSLTDPGLLPWINAYLNAARLRGDCLVFELSEEGIHENLSLVKDFATGLQQLHCEIAIDHVTGAIAKSNYLRHVPAKYIKIDGSIISSITNDSSSQEAAKLIAGIGQSQNKLTVAEFVHDANTLAMLWQYGVNFVQGYYLQKPAPQMQYDFSST